MSQDPFELDWSAVTPDVLTRDGLAVHAVNHNLQDAAIASDDDLRALAGRLG